MFRNLAYAKSSTDGGRANMMSQRKASQSFFLEEYARLSSDTLHALSVVPFYVAPGFIIPPIIS